MNKKDISKILASGTARQKYLLIAEDTARARHSLSRILTDAEVRALVDSIKTPQEIKAYNRLREADKLIMNSLSILIQFRILYSKTIVELDKFTLLWDSYQTTEELVNYILMETKNPQDRQAIAEKAVIRTGRYIVVNPIEVDKYGFIKIDIRYKGKKKQNISTEEALEILKKRALYELVELKSLAQAMLDYMEDKGLSIKLYKDIIKEQLRLAMAEKSALPKYSPTWESGDYKRGFMPWQDLLPQYRVYPDPETPPDPKRIAYFRKEILEANE